MIRLLLDEHISPRVADGLRRRNRLLEVSCLAEWEEGEFLGQQDSACLQQAAVQGWTFVTYDRSTIPPLLKAWAEEERKHGEVILPLRTKCLTFCEAFKTKRSPCPPPDVTCLGRLLHLYFSCSSFCCFFTDSDGPRHSVCGQLLPTSNSNRLICSCPLDRQPFAADFLWMRTLSIKTSGLTSPLPALYPSCQRSLKKT